jgi:hypothetical protein
MGEFFRRWRRKVGLVTLVMALVFMSGWVRSRSRIDLIKLNGTKSYCVFISGGQKFLLLQGIQCLMSRNLCEQASVRYVRLRFYPQYPADTSGRRFEWWSREESKIEVFSPDDEDVPHNMIPYWSIVIPLALISAFLLLTKPLISTQEKSVETTPEHID